MPDERLPLPGMSQKSDEAPHLSHPFQAHTLRWRRSPSLYSLPPTRFAAGHANHAKLLPVMDRTIS